MYAPLDGIILRSPVKLLSLFILCNFVFIFTSTLHMYAEMQCSSKRIMSNAETSRWQQVFVYCRCSVSVSREGEEDFLDLGIIFILMTTSAVCLFNSAQCRALLRSKERDLQAAIDGMDEYCLTERWINEVHVFCYQWNKGFVTHLRGAGISAINVSSAFM